MSNIKTIKRGEPLYKEGDKINSLYLIQSGAAQLCLIRNKKNIDMMTVGAGSVLGTQAMTGMQVYDHSCLAQTETKYLEIPIELGKTQVESAPQFVKILIKSLNDRVRLSINELKSLKIEKDPAPMPDDQVAKAFGCVFHTANHKGERDSKDKNKVRVEWNLLKQYSQRVFGESPRRLEQTINLLVKLKLATHEMGKPPENPDGPDEVVGVFFNDLLTLEGFFEFYQYHYFKNGKSEVLKIDDSVTNLVQEFVKVGDTLQKDRFGAVQLEMPKAIETFKSELGINLNNGHFTQMEIKGIFAKRTARADGNVVIQWDQKEFSQVLKSWKILKEVERWNEKGFVDMTEDDKVKKKSTGGGPTCPSCSVEVAAQAKFCHECGAKLLAQAG